LLDENDLKQIRDMMLETLEPLFIKIYNKQSEHDKKFEQIDRRLDQIEARLDKLENRMGKMEDRMDKLENSVDALKNDVAEIKGYHKNPDKTLDMIKRLYTDLTFKVGTLEDRIYEMENNPVQAGSHQKYGEIKHEIKALKERINRLERIVDKACEN